MKICDRLLYSLHYQQIIWKAVVFQNWIVVVGTPKKVTYKLSGLYAISEHFNMNFGLKATIN